MMRGGSLAIMLFVASLSACATQDSKVEGLTRPNECTAVYVLKPQGGAGQFVDMHEVSVSVDGMAFTTKGKLFRRDWGAFKVCGRQLTLRFRSITSGFRVSGPTVLDVNSDIKVDMRSRGDVFVELGFKWSEIPEERARKVKADIEAKLGPPAPTGWEWKDRRELYYSKDCQVRSELCP